MSKEQYIEALGKRFFPFRHGVEHLFSLGEIRNLKKGDVVYRRGDTVKEWPILLSGCARHLGQTDEGKDIVIGIYVTPGDSLLPYDAVKEPTVAVQSEVQMTRSGAVFYVPIETVLKQMRVEPELIRIALNSQADYLKWYMRYHLAQSQYRNNLKGLYRHIVQTDSNLVAHASIEDLASFLSVSYYHLCRVRQELKREEPELFEALKAHR